MPRITGIPSPKILSMMDKSDREPLGKAGLTAPEIDAKIEATLEAYIHNQILQACLRNGWVALHGQMNKPTRRTPGEPDFIILLPDNRLVCFEVKTRTGILNDDQKELHAKAKAINHHIPIIRSYEQFLSLVNSVNPTFKSYV